MVQRALRLLFYCFIEFNHNYYNQSKQFNFCIFRLEEIYLQFSFINIGNNNNIAMCTSYYFICLHFKCVFV